MLAFPDPCVQGTYFLLLGLYTYQILSTGGC